MQKLVAFVTSVLISVPTILAVVVVLEGPAIVEPSAVAGIIAGDVEPADVEPAPDPDDCKTCLDYDQCTVCSTIFVTEVGLTISSKCDNPAGADHGFQEVLDDPGFCSAAKKGDPQDCGGIFRKYLGAGCKKDNEIEMDPPESCKRKWRTCKVQACSDPNLVCPKGKPTPKPEDPTGGGTL